MANAVLNDAAASEIALWPTLSRGVPRVLLSSFGPILGYTAGSSLGGPPLGIAMATAASLSLWTWERRAGRPGLIARFALGLVLVQVTLSLVFRDPALYFAPKAVADICVGLVFYGSCFTRLPLATIFARELLAARTTAYERPALRGTFIHITCAWGSFYTLRGTVTLTALAASGPAGYLLTKGVMDAVLIAPLAAGCLAYGLHRLRTLPATHEGAIA